LFEKLSKIRPGDPVMKKNLQIKVDKGYHAKKFLFMFASIKMITGK